MPVELPPDAETTLVKFLLDDADVSALVGANVSTRLPSNPPFPFIVVQLISTSPVGGIETNINEYWMQVDVYAGKNDFSTSSTLARTIQAVFFEAYNTNVTVTGSGESALVYGSRIRNYRKVPEPETEWARYMIDVLVTMRFSS